MTLTSRIRAAWQVLTKSGAVDQWFNKIGIPSGDPAKLTEPYRKSAWVSRAIKHVFEPITGVPLMFSKDKAGGQSLVTDSRLEEYWAAPALGPNGLCDIREVVAATIGWLKLAGESFWIFDDMLMAPF